MNRISLQYNNRNIQQNLLETELQNFWKKALPCYVLLIALSLYRIGVNPDETSEVIISSLILAFSSISSCFLCIQKFKIYLLILLILLTYMSWIEWMAFHDREESEVRTSLVSLSLMVVYEVCIFFIILPIGVLICHILGLIYALVRFGLEYEKFEPVIFLMLLIVPIVLAYWITWRHMELFMEFFEFKQQATPKIKATENSSTGLIIYWDRDMSYFNKTAKEIISSIEALDEFKPFFESEPSVDEIVEAWKNQAELERTSSLYSIENKIMMVKTVPIAIEHNECLLISLTDVTLEIASEKKTVENEYVTESHEYVESLKPYFQGLLASISFHNSSIEFEVFEDLKGETLAAYYVYSAICDYSHSIFRRGVQFNFEKAEIPKELRVLEKLTFNLLLTKQLELTVNIEEDLPKKIYIDIVQFRSLLLLCLSMISKRKISLNLFIIQTTVRELVFKISSKKHLNIEENVILKLVEEMASVVGSQGLEIKTRSISVSLYAPHQVRSKQVKKSSSSKSFDIPSDSDHEVNMANYL